MLRTTGRPVSRRAGFSFIELLIVIGLIVVLAALTISATQRVVGSQRISNTEKTVQKVATGLQKQFNVVVEQARHETIPPAALAVLTPLAGTDAEAPRRARVLWIKLRVKGEFPMTFEEIRNPAPGLPALLPHLQVRAYVAGIIGVPATPDPAIWPAEAQASACLYLALKRERKGERFNPDEALTAAELGDRPAAASSSQNVKLLIDRWGSPLSFCRWPIESEFYNPSGPSAGFHDAVDPEGLLSSATWSGGALTTLLHPFVPGRSYKLAPVVLSLGPNKKLGLDLRTLRVAAPTADADDNIYSYNLR